MTLDKPVEETVKALAGTPMLLVLVVMNVMVLGMVTYLTMKSSELRAKERTELVQMLDACMKK